jgi:hypothetical protein
MPLLSLAQRPMASGFQFASVETSTAYSEILENLEREIRRERPSDVLQFCADYFNGKLAEQRQTFLSQGTTGLSGVFLTELVMFQ